MRLISMTDFVLQRTNKKIEYADEFDYLNWRNNDLKEIEKYANFLKQPLELWMFVPCKLVNGVWLVLEEPDDAKDYIFRGESMRHEDLQEYQQAKERCLFMGFKVCNRQNELICLVCNEEHFLIKQLLKETIEDLIKYNLELTETAIKQRGL